MYGEPIFLSTALSHRETRIIRVARTTDATGKEIRRSVAVDCGWIIAVTFDGPYAEGKEWAEIKHLAEKHGAVIREKVRP